MDYLKVVRWFSLFPHKKGYPIGNILSFQTSMLRKTTIGRGEKHYSIVIVNYWWYYVILIIYIYIIIVIYYYHYYYYHDYCCYYYCITGAIIGVGIIWCYIYIHIIL